MAEDKKTPAKASTSPKKAPAKKAATAKTETTAKAKPASEKKSATPKANKPSGNTITVRQIGSPIGRPKEQRGTLIGLGLNKMHKTRTLEDNPSVRGMIRSVPHLVEIVEDAA